jgi:hypothetical protein
VSTHSVIVVPIPAAYPLLLLPPSGSPAGRLRLIRVHSCPFAVNLTSPALFA